MESIIEGTNNSCQCYDLSSSLACTLNSPATTDASGKKPLFMRSNGKKEHMDQILTLTLAGPRCFWVFWNQFARPLEPGPPTRPTRPTRARWHRAWP